MEPTQPPDRNRGLYRVAALLALLAVALVLGACVSEEAFTFGVRVMDRTGNNTIPNARVVLDVPGRPSLSDFTDDNGRASIPLDGEYAGQTGTIRVEAEGYAPRNYDITLQPGQVVQDIQLDPTTASDATPAAEEEAIIEEELAIARSVAAQLEALAPGLLTFSITRTMRVGDTYLVQARITRELTDTATLDPANPEAEPFTADLAGGTAPTIEEIDVGTFMRVRLRGQNFDVEPLTEENQVVGPRGFTEWSWNVTPLWHGRQQLELLATVRVTAGGSEEVRNLPVKRELIDVQVNPVYTAAAVGRDYWPVLVALAVLGGLLPLGLRLSRRRGGTSDEQADGILDADKHRASLLRQLEEARENLQLIEERKATYVQAEDIPLQLIKNERDLEERIEELEAQLRALAAPREE